MFYFDLGSPYAWLSAERIDTVLGDADWRPLSLGGLFKANGRSSWGLGEGRDAGIAEVERRAAAYGLPRVRWPEPWPGHMLMAMRAATVAKREGRVREFALAAFRRAFVEGRDLGSPDEVLTAAKSVGVNANAVGDQAIKDELRRVTDEAHALGVMGVPTVVVAGDLFWGDDRLEAAAAQAA